jgi:hypothetical protein
MHIQGIICDVAKHTASTKHQNCALLEHIADKFNPRYTYHLPSTNLRFAVVRRRWLHEEQPHCPPASVSGVYPEMPLLRVTYHKVQLDYTSRQETQVRETRQTNLPGAECGARVVVVVRAGESTFIICSISPSSASVEVAEASVEVAEGPPVVWTKAISGNSNSMSAAEKS